MTLLVIHSYPGVNQLVHDLWPYYEKSGWPILGVGSEDGLTEWPEGIPFIELGRDAYIQDQRNLPERMVGTFRHCLSTDYDDFCVIEYDSVFLGRLPPYPLPAAQLSGFNKPGFKAQYFWHCPWHLDRATAALFVAEGERLLSAGVYEQGTPDFFFGLVMENIGIFPHNIGSFSVNSLDTSNNMGLARDALARGCKFFHGVKSLHQLSELLKNIP